MIVSLNFQVSQKVQESLTERAASFGLILDDISLVKILYDNKNNNNNFISKIAVCLYKN